MADKDVAEVLRTARDLGWTAMKGGNDHWKLVPPGGFTEAVRTPLGLPSTPRGSRWRSNFIAEARRYPHCAGQVLADAITGTTPKAPKPASEVAYIEPEEARKETASKEMQMDVEDIGPARAGVYLSTRFEGQRKIRETSVIEYAADMAADRWTVSNDAVTFDQDGKLINGQHRLMAIIRSGKTVRMIVLRGMPTEAYEAMDTGKKRGLADLLASRGWTNVNTIAPAVYMVHAYAALGEPYGRAKGRTSMRVMYEFAERNRGISDFARDADAAYTRFLLSRGLFAALFYLFNTVNTDLYQEFFRVLTTGKTNGDPDTDPAMLLRASLLTRLATSKERRLSPTHYAALIVKAWNAYAKGDAVRLLKWGRSEGFPAIFDPDDKLIQVVDPGQARLHQLVAEGVS